MYVEKIRIVKLLPITKRVIGRAAVVATTPGVDAVRGDGERHVSEDHHQTVSYTVIGSAFQGWSIHECSMQDKYDHTLAKTHAHENLTLGPGFNDHHTMYYVCYLHTPPPQE